MLHVFSILTLYQAENTPTGRFVLAFFLASLKKSSSRTVLNLQLWHWGSWCSYKNQTGGFCNSKFHDQLQSIIRLMASFLTMGLVRITSWYPVSMEAMLACHPARSTEWLDCHPKWCELWHFRTGPILSQFSHSFVWWSTVTGHETCSYKIHWSVSRNVFLNDLHRDLGLCTFRCIILELVVQHFLLLRDGQFLCNHRPAREGTHIQAMPGERLYKTLHRQLVEITGSSKALFSPYSNPTLTLTLTLLKVPLPKCKP